MTRAATLTERITLRDGARKVEQPVDALGRVRWRAELDHRSISRQAAGEAIGFRGHAAVFNQKARIGGSDWGFWEQVGRGAFRKTLGEADVRFLINHDPNLVLARTAAGTLRLSEDNIGLYTDADMAPVSYASDLAVLLERRDVTQMSFAFEPTEYRIEAADDGSELITLTAVRLWDVSAVTYPAYEETDAALRGVGFDRLCGDLDIDERFRSVLLRGRVEAPPELRDAVRLWSTTVLEVIDEDDPADTTTPDDGTAASSDGAIVVKSQRMACPSCAGDIADDTNYCPLCGAAVRAAAPAATRSDSGGPDTATLLALRTRMANTVH